MRDGAVALSDHGFWLADGDFSSCDEGFDAARAVVGSRCHADGIEPLPIIGDFVIPPPDGMASRDFQTLHFDFGLPLVPMVAQDGARSRSPGTSAARRATSTGVRSSTTQSG